MKKILIILALFCFTMSFANLSFAQTPGAVTCEITDPDTGVTAKDTDCDNVADENDNCPEVRNGDCEDSESFCDTDDNGELDSFEIAGGFQIDSNRNDIGDACDDRDADSVSDAADNCPDVNNPGQTDSNNDQIGDACTDMSDDDEDGIAAFEDNCPFNANPDQTDNNQNAIGDVCEAGGGGASPPTIFLMTQATVSALTDMQMAVEVQQNQLAEHA